MVEGHQCHRVAHFHRQKLLHRSFTATSPNGRFAEGAAAIAAAGPLRRIEVHGKNLFYFFGSDDAGSIVLHFHFGMAGAFSVHPLPGGAPPRATTRLELIDSDRTLVAHLSAMVVQHGDLAFYAAKAAALGQDPLREDADPEAVWATVAASKKPVGLLLMDQSVIAGVGNIYRAEILFKAGVHPEQPGRTLSRPKFDSIWRHSCDLLRRGFQTGSILTVDPEEAAVLGPPWTRRYIYNQAACGRCGCRIQTWTMAARTVYACTTCQPLAADAAGAAVALPEARRKALAAAAGAVQFVSHCAPDDAGDAGTPAGKLSLAALRARAAAAGLSAAGRKAELVVRLEAAAAKQAAPAAPSPSTLPAAKKQEEEEAVVPTPAKQAQRTKSRARQAPPKRMRGAGGGPPALSPELYAWGREGAPRAGTAGVGHVATAEEAALEKAAAGEGRGVEHVALQDAATAALAAGGGGTRSGKRRRA